MKIIGIHDEEEKRELNHKKVIGVTIISIIVFILLIMVCVYVGNKEFRDFVDHYILMKNVKENNLTSISLDDSESNYVYAYDKYISVFNQNTLTGYLASGKKEYELTVQITNPLIDINHRFLLIAENKKQKIYLIEGNRIVWEKELEGNISRVSVNKNGYVSVVLSGTTYQSIIQSFDATGKEMFKTYLSNSIAVDTDISYDNRYLSFAEVSTDGTLVQSIIKTISIQTAQETPSESIVSSITSPSNYVVANLKYQEGNRLVCMYDKAVYTIQNGSQEELFKLEEDGRRIPFADIELTNFTFRMLEKSSLLSTETTVELKNTTTKKENRYQLDGVVKEVYCYDSSIALNLGSEVHFIGTNGWLNKKYTSSQEVRKIVMGSNFAGIVYRDKIEIVNL